MRGHSIYPSIILCNQHTSTIMNQECHTRLQNLTAVTVQLERMTLMNNCAVFVCNAALFLHLTSKVNHLLTRAIATSTRATYSSIIKRYPYFCFNHHLVTANNLLPIPTEVTLAYFFASLQEQVQYHTAKLYLAAYLAAIKNISISNIIITSKQPKCSNFAAYSKA